MSTMKLVSTIKGNFEKAIRLMKKYEEIKQESSVENVMTELGEKCVQTLSSNAPKDSGEYASSFTNKVEAEENKISANIYNSSHSEVAQKSGSTLSELITYGHGTGTGGYVPANKFIKKSVDSVDMTKIGKVVANVE